MTRKPERIGICLIATGPYIQWFDQLHADLNERFLPGHPKTVFLFTDAEREFPQDTRVYPISRKGFPGDTLYRYHYILQAVSEIRALTDVVYYLDVDMRVLSEVGPEILPDEDLLYVGVSHPGFWMGRTPNLPLGTPETNPRSTAFISPEENRPCYWAGGFQGGSTQAFLEMAKIIRRNINKDDEQGLMAVWHDESHLNRYFTTLRGMVKTLTPDYCYPESWDLGHNLTKRIVALDKDHAKVRA